MIIVLYILIALVIAGLLAMLAGYSRNRSLQKQMENGEIAEMPSVAQPPQECCGQHEVCEKESLLAAVSKEVEYYEDEELDRFRGRTSSDYTEEETEEFRNILYTMQDEEVAGWVRSLQLRNVSLPDALKDEIFLIVGERRFEHS